MNTPVRGRLSTINPLIKLAATFPPLVFVLFVRDTATPALIAVGAAVVILAGTRVRVRTVVIAAAVVLFLGAWTTLLFALLARRELVADSPVVVDGWITLHADALDLGAATALRLIAIIMLALLGSAGTTTAGLSSALVRQLHVPYRYVHSAMAAARFAPRYRDDLRTLRAAHRARGITDPAGPVGFVRRTRRSTIPLLAGGARYAERLSLAMDARGFGAYPHRSDRHPATLRARDGLFLLGVWAGVAMVAALTTDLGLLRWSGSLHGLG